MAAHSQQTAEFIKGDYDGGSAELIRLCLPAALATSLARLLSALALQKFACHATPSGRRSNQIQIRFKPAPASLWAFSQQMENRSSHLCRCLENHYPERWQISFSIWRWNICYEVFFLYMRTCLCCLLWSFHIQTLRNGWIWAAVQTVQCFQGSNHNNRSTSILIKSWSLPPFQVHSSAMFLSLVLLKTWTLNGHLCRTVCEQPVISTLMKSIILLAVKCSPCKDSLSCSNDAVKDRRRCHGRVDNKSESLRPMLK